MQVYRYGYTEKEEQLSVIEKDVRYFAVVLFDGV